jgi:hypothetical protein
VCGRSAYAVSDETGRRLPGAAARSNSGVMLVVVVQLLSGELGLEQRGRR